MPYLGKSPLTGNFQKLDDFSGDFDGSGDISVMIITFRCNRCIKKYKKW